jgi:hypothetical protein
MISLQEATTRYPFLKVGSDGVLEIYADHHTLSSVRKCEAYFIESIANRLSGTGRAWSLEFGSWLHYCLEYYYQNQKNGKDVSVYELSKFGGMAWDKLDMDFWSKIEDKRCKTIGGKLGAVVMLAEYHAMYMSRERLRTVATEVGFGYAKEVPILTDHTLYSYAPFRAYYTGRIDRIVDNGTVISPFDHKSQSAFTGKEVTSFKPHEGMQGYVYATSHIISGLFPEIAAEGRICNSITINHISLKPCTNPLDRFKRSTPTWTPTQMEQWRLRQVSTFSRIYEMLVLERPADYSTDYCNMMYHHECPYKALHEQDDEYRPIVMNQKYVQVAPWNPYESEAAEEQKFIDEVEKEAGIATV